MGEMDKIKITNLKVFAHHGVFPEETKNGQDFYVNAVLSLDCRVSGMSDRLEDSINYGEVCQFITAFLTEHTYKLIETAAEQLAREMLLSMDGLREVKIELCKPNAPIGLPFENVSVEITRSWHKAYIAVGSNMGDKKACIENGIRRLSVHPDIRVEKKSDFITTAPYGMTRQDVFLNGAIAIDTLLSPKELLFVLHEAEREEGRKREIHWGPRTLDLDIIFYDKLVYEDEELILPHVDMENRVFVLKPLLQLCPNYRHPILQKTVRELYLAAVAKASAEGKEI
jgi:dihydroneopterin aldolase/2-amino-4-hydroxy-6-hydroxymethyldihydropteridine diphosphokinase